MEALDVLGDPVRRRILELLAGGELSAGAISTTIGNEFGISQPAVSQHLRVLRESGFATARPDGARRLYAIEPAAFDDVETWLGGLRQAWGHRLDALATELARGRRTRRRADASESPPTTPPSATKTETTTTTTKKRGTR